MTPFSDVITTRSLRESPFSDLLRSHSNNSGSNSKEGRSVEGGEEGAQDGEGASLLGDLTALPLLLQGLDNENPYHRKAARKKHRAEIREQLRERRRELSSRESTSGGGGGGAKDLPRLGQAKGAGTGVGAGLGWEVRASGGTVAQYGQYGRRCELDTTVGRSRGRVTYRTVKLAPPPGARTKLIK